MPQPPDVLRSARQAVGDQLVACRLHFVETGRQLLELTGQFRSPLQRGLASSVNFRVRNGRQNPFVDRPDGLAQLTDAVLQRHDQRIQQIKSVQQGIVDFDGDVRRQTQIDLQLIDTRLVLGLGGREGKFLVEQILPRLCNLQLVADNLRGVIGDLPQVFAKRLLKLDDVRSQTGDVRALVADVLLVLQQSQESAHLQSSARRFGAAGPREHVAHAAKTAAHTRKTFQAGTAKQPTEPLCSARAAGACRQIQVEAAAETFHLPHVRQQLPLGQRQSRQHAVATAFTQQRLHQGEVQQAERSIRIGSVKIPDQAVGEIHHQVAARDERAAEVRVRIHAESTAWQVSIDAARPVKRLKTPIPLTVEAKPFGTHVQRRQVKRFVRLLVFGRVQQGQVDGCSQIETQHACAVQRQVLEPFRCLDVIGAAVLAPMRIIRLTVHDVHQLVRRGIVRWHRRTVGIEGIEHPRTGIDRDARPRHFPARRNDLLPHQGCGLGVRLAAVMGPIAGRVQQAGDGQTESQTAPSGGGTAVQHPGRLPP